MQLDLTLSKKVLILVTLPIIFMLLFVTVLAYQQKVAEDAVWKERHLKDVSNECNSLMKNMLDAGLCVHLYKLQQNIEFSEKFDSLCEKIPEQIRTLKLLLKDKPAQLKRLNKLDAIITRSLNDLGETKSFSRYKLNADVINSKTQMIQGIGETSKLLRELVNELQRAGPVDSHAQETARLMVSSLLVFGVIGSIILAFVLATAFNRSTTKRLLVLVDNTDRLRKHKELNPVLSGNDEIARLDQVFHDMANSLNEAAQYKQEMMSVVSHDLRTPLTSIQGVLTILSAGVLGELPPKAEKNIKTAEKNCRQLVNLINDLLDFEKLESGRLEFSMKPFVVQELFEQVESMVSIAAEQKGIKLKVEETELIVNGDFARLSQVLINLITNAVKFSPEGSTITLSAKQMESIAEIRVTDQGRGIPAAYIDKIFDRYGQVKKEDSERGRGTGLGLAICKAFVEGHGGKIGVDSEEGKGSSFWIRLPI